MSKVVFTKVNLRLPIYNSASRSFASKLLNAISIGKLDKDAKGHISVHALADISFSLQDGDRLGVIGGNGAGKSTLLRVIAEIYPPTEGFVEIEGTLGSLIDISLGINPEATGRENVFTRGTLLGLSKSFISEKFDEIVEFSELNEFIDMPVRTYSSGMLMRLGFSISTILKPEILLMDEWLAVGDEKFRRKAELRLQAIFETTRILILASHSRELIEGTCNKALWLENGKMKMFGSVSDVCEKYFAG